ncbi:MAG: hypothetical protein IID39_02095 [Planctomycetes bacterium]|nr:hypothetical protein [Planctomycetota bacterium]
MAIAPLWWAAGGCRRGGQDEAGPGARDSHAELTVRVDFPDSALVDDPTVNEFLRMAMAACAGGDYDQFRRLWSAKAEPLTREQFERGWNSAESIAVLAVQPMRHPGNGSLLYYAHARFELAANLPDPRREVVVLIIEEEGAWCLARAPKALTRKVLGLEP